MPNAIPKGIVPAPTGIIMPQTIFSALTSQIMKWISGGQAEAPAEAPPAEAPPTGKPELAAPLAMWQQNMNTLHTTFVNNLTNALNTLNTVAPHNVIPKILEGGQLVIPPVDELRELFGPAEQMVKGGQVSPELYRRLYGIEAPEY